MRLSARNYDKMSIIHFFDDVRKKLKGSVKEPNKFHNKWKITRKASDTAEYIELFGSSTRDRHTRRIFNVIL